MASGYRLPCSRVELGQRAASRGYGGRPLCRRVGDGIGTLFVTGVEQIGPGHRHLDEGLVAAILCRLNQRRPAVSSILVLHEP